LVALISVQYTRLAQLVKSCGEWISACDDEYFEKQELNGIIKEFETFYQKAFAAKRSAAVTLDGDQFHRHCVVNLAKRFPVFQVHTFLIVEFTVSFFFFLVSRACQFFLKLNVSVYLAVFISIFYTLADLVVQIKSSDKN
jgi:hypothetical protein